MKRFFFTASAAGVLGIELARQRKNAKLEEQATVKAVPKYSFNHGLLLSGQSESGKSAVTEYFETQGLSICAEAAKRLWEEYSKEAGRDLWAQPDANELVVKQQQQDLAVAMGTSGITVIDRSPIDTVTFGDVYPGQYNPVELDANDINRLREFAAGTVYFLKPNPKTSLDSQDCSNEREFDSGNEDQIAQAIKAKYEQYGFKVVMIDWVARESQEEAVAEKALKIFDHFEDHLRKTYSDRDVAVIKRVSQHPPKVETDNHIPVRKESENGSQYYIWCIEKSQQAERVKELRQELFQRMPGTTRVVQIVGDCELFSEQGTRFAKKIIESYILDEENILELGHSGLFENEANDVNGIMIDLAERNSADKRLVSNVVGDCIKAIEEWGFRTCRSTSNHMVLVYNQDGRPTKFGDDCDISDKIMQEGDILILCEGGAQSLLQSLNAINQGATVVALEGLREKDTAKFSAARFYQRVSQGQEELTETHLEEEKNQQQEWKPNKRALLEKAEELLRDPVLQRKIRSVEVESLSATESLSKDSILQRKF